MFKSIVMHDGPFGPARSGGALTYILPYCTETDGRGATLDPAGGGIQPIAFGDGAVSTNGNRRLYLGPSPFTATFYITPRWLLFVCQPAYTRGDIPDVISEQIRFNKVLVYGGKGDLLDDWTMYAPNYPVDAETGQQVGGMTATVEVQGEVQWTRLYGGAAAICTVPFKVLRGQFTLLKPDLVTPVSLVPAF